MTTSDAMRAALSWLATYSVHSTLFLGATWLLVTLRPPRANKNRERAWKLALVGGLLSASLQSAIGTRPLLGRIDWHPTEVARAPDEASPSTAAAPAQARALTPSDARSSGKIGGASSAPDSAPEVSRTLAPAPTTRTTPLASDAVPTLAANPPGLEADPVPSLPPTAREHGTRSRAPAPRPAGAEALPVRDEPVRERLASELRTEPTIGLERWRAPDEERAELPLATSTLAAPRRALERLTSAWTERWAGWVLLAWSAAGLLGVAGILASWGCLHRRMLGRRTLTEGALPARLEVLRRRSGFGRRVRLSVSRRVSAPFSTGLLRLEICVPEAVLTDLTPTQQEALLAHELAHLVRRDPAWFGFSTLIERLFFFQPLNRLARRELAELAELACDDWAVRWTGARLALASCLTQVAGWVIGERPRLVTPPGFAGARSPLGRRVERLLDDRRSPAGEPPTPWWPPLAAGALVTAALAVPGVAAVESRIESTPPGAAASPVEKPWMRSTESPAPVVPEQPATLPDPLASSELASQRAQLESELAELEGELALLDQELAARDLRGRFGAALERIQVRMNGLRIQHERARALLAELEPLITPHLITPVRAPAPAAEALDSIAQPGVSR